MLSPGILSESGSGTGTVLCCGTGVAVGVMVAVAVGATTVISTTRVTSTMRGVAVGTAYTVARTASATRRGSGRAGWLSCHRLAASSTIQMLSRMPSTKDVSGLFRRVKSSLHSLAQPRHQLAAPECGGTGKKEQYVDHPQHEPHRKDDDGVEQEQPGNLADHDENDGQHD